MKDSVAIHYEVLEQQISYRDSLIRHKEKGYIVAGTNQSLDDLIASAEVGIRHTQMVIDSFER